MLLGSFSFVGHRDDGRDPAAALRGARRADDVRPPVVPAARVSGVYYSIDVLPGWMQVLSHLSPATYVLDGVRAGLIDGTPVTGAAPRRLAAARDGRRAHPARPLGVRPRRALRQAHRQAQAGRLMDDPAGIGRPRRPRLGRRAGRRPFLPTRAARADRRRGSWPSTARPAIVRAAAGGATGRRVVSGRFRFDGARPGDLPAVGDWVGRRAAADGNGAADDRPSIAGRPAAPDRVPALRRRLGAPRVGQPRRRAGPGRQRRRRVHRRGPRRRLQPAPDRALPRGRLGERRDAGPRPQQGRRRDRPRGAPRSRPRPSRRASPILVVSALTGDGIDALRRRTSAAGRTAVVLGSSGVGKSTLAQRAARRGAPATGAVREDDSRGRHTTTHRELFGCPAARCSSTRPASASLEVAGADGRPRRRVRRHRRRSPPRAASATAATRASPAARSRRPSPTGRSTAARLASHRKLEREAAHEARRVDPLARRRGAAQVEGDPQVGRPAHDAQVRGGSAMTDVTELDRDLVTFPAPPHPGLRFRRLRGRDDLAGHGRGEHGDPRRVQHRGHRQPRGLRCARTTT